MPWRVVASTQKATLSDALAPAVLQEEKLTANVKHVHTECVVTRTAAVVLHRKSCLSLWPHSCLLSHWTIQVE